MIAEVVVYNLESALKAQEGGANRIELCDNAAEGGTTPSQGMFETVRRNLNIDVYVMIRPRGGDFCYSRYEYEAMKQDLMMCKRAGIDGVVLGILKPVGTLDKERCSELVHLARPMGVTCHRAFDMTTDPMQALEDCIGCGFDRILTAGQKPKAGEGVELIAKLLKEAKGRIKIMPGSGVNEHTVKDIVSGTGVSEIHFSATAYRESEMVFKNKEIIRMGEEEGSEYKVRTVDPERVKNIIRLSGLTSA